MLNFLFWSLFGLHDFTDLFLCYKLLGRLRIWRSGGGVALVCDSLLCLSRVLTSHSIHRLLADHLAWPENASDARLLARLPRNGSAGFRSLCLVLIFRPDDGTLWD